MNVFEVLYFDGQTSLGKQAKLILLPHSLRIEYYENDEATAIIWDIKDIHPVQILKDLHIFKYGDFPLQQIECRVPSILSALKNQYPTAKFLKGDPIFSLNPSRIFTATIILIATLTIVYFWILPSAAENIAEKVPLSMEVALGNSLYKGFMDGYTEDEKISALVNDFAKQIDFSTDYTINITVVKNPELNAFALPGGKIVVYDGILKKMKTSEELAALLAHEVGHIRHKHSLKSLCRSLSGYFLISMISSDLNGFATTMADNANTLHNLKYSRTLEADADENAVQTLNRNKLSQKGLTNLFTILKKEERIDRKYLSFLSTHPLTTERLEKARINERAQKSFNKNPLLDEKFKLIKEAL